MRTGVAHRVCAEAQHRFDKGVKSSLWDRPAGARAPCRTQDTQAERKARCPPLSQSDCITALRGK